MTLAATRRGVAQASILDTMRVAGLVLTPIVARGVIIRRHRVLALLSRMDADRRAVRLLAALRDKYGPGLLALRVPGRRIVLVLSPDGVRRILTGSPEPFATANREKHAALSRFQPHGVLISHGAQRENRRQFTEHVLDTHRETHSLGDRFTAVVAEETRAILAATPGSLRWDEFAEGWWRIVRRVVFGDAARDDDALTDLLARLRRNANWASLHPPRPRLRHRFLAEVRALLSRAEPGSLAAMIASTPSTPDTHPESQVAHWLFAFDAAGMATFRALALLSVHNGPHDSGHLRAAVQEALRLWPTTPIILRDATTETDWDGETLPAGTTYVIPAPFLHRDSATIPYADEFHPQAWLDGDAWERWSIVPFSAGPAQCPGRNLVLLLTSNTLANLLAAHDFRLSNMDLRDPLPGTLNHFGLTFTVTDREERSR